ncbi:MAG: A/G-specific adenine glycosylase [Gammaproteobacteria bacterium]|nr:A/G-specific adenine glycosylase [Gammaproteobacteria bacterium]
MDWFATRLLSWFDHHGRRDLPWQIDVNPYRVWVSETMLQQTQVTTVIPYFERFMTSFPTVAELAVASRDEVLHHWTGLGYYARARNLHKAAQTVASEKGGVFPSTLADLQGLPGIGRSTAAAILSISQGGRAPILDGNVKRVLARFHAVAGYPGDAAPQRLLWKHAESHTPAKRVAHYTQAIMDLGATLCTRTQPRCGVCPVAARCLARQRQETNRYPERKPQKEKPVRAVRFFLFTTPDDGCLLEQRPPNGIWGGLWTPPERAADAEIMSVCREFGVDPGNIEESYAGDVFRHTFTHFLLDIEPVYIHLAYAPCAVRDDDRLRWYHPDRQEVIGLSAPAVKLLANIQEYALS